MARPLSPRAILLWLLLSALLVGMIQMGLVSVAIEKLGLSPLSGLLLLFSSLLGSLINLPVFTLSQSPRDPLDDLPSDRPPHPSTTVIAVNLGGCIVPLAFSLFLIRYSTISVDHLLMAILFVSLVCYFSSRPIAKVGIGMPALIAPLAAAAIALLLTPENAAPLAYVAGTLGVLIGADLLRLKDIAALQAPVAAIGGAGTFDGIFITGLIAVLLT